MGRLKSTAELSRLIPDNDEALVQFEQRLLDERNINYMSIAQIERTIQRIKDYRSRNHGNRNRKEV